MKNENQIIPGAKVLIYNYGAIIGDGTVKEIIGDRAIMESPLHGYADHPVGSLKVDTPALPGSSVWDVLRSLYT